MTKIAFLGTGLMGTGMGGRLVQAGHEVTVYNRTVEKTAVLVAAGARAVATPAAAVAGADVVFAMVGDDAASKAVWLGADGVFNGDLADGAICVECSTLSHDWVLELSQAAAAKSHIYIDSPVTGYPHMAASGDLTLFIGATDDDLEAARPYLLPLCREIIHFGEVGAGTAYKLMVNLMGAVQIAAAAEGLLIAEKAGLDRKLVTEAIGKGAAASPQVIRNSKLMADDHHDRDIVFPASLRLKDTLYGLALADKVGQTAVFGEVAGRAIQKLVDQGDGDLNESKVIDALRS